VQRTELPSKSTRFLARLRSGWSFEDLGRQFWIFTTEAFFFDFGFDLYVFLFKLFLLNLHYDEWHAHGWGTPTQIAARLLLCRILSEPSLGAGSAALSATLIVRYGYGVVFNANSVLAIVADTSSRGTACSRPASC
jgi:hypothetical protein